MISQWFVLKDKFVDSAILFHLIYLGEICRCGGKDGSRRLLEFAVLQFEDSPLFAFAVAPTGEHSRMNRIARPLIVLVAEEYCGGVAAATHTAARRKPSFLILIEKALTKKSGKSHLLGTRK